MRTRPPCPAQLAVALLVAGLGASAPPPADADERGCLMEYVRQRSHPEKALRLLAECARRHPESFAIQRTLGRRLATLAPTAADPQEMRRRAIGHLERAAAADPTQFAEDWPELATLYEAVGRHAEAGAALQQGLPYLEPSARLATLERLWDLYALTDRRDGALPIWEQIHLRRRDDLPSVLRAAELLHDAARLRDARECYERALELDPASAAARRGFEATLAATAMQGGSGDKRRLVELWLPRLAEAEASLLPVLLTAAGDVYWPEAAEAVARELAAREADEGAALLVLAEAAEADRQHAEAGRLAERALGGSLNDDARGRAHAVAGRSFACRAHTRYERSGTSAGAGDVEETARLYRRALRHLEAARRLGIRVDRDVDAAEEALRRLGSARTEIERLRRETAREACAELRTRARLGYEQDRPLRRRIARDSDLARHPGGGERLVEIPEGTDVRVADATWTAGRCWLEVRLQDGTAGWIPEELARP